MNMQLKEKLKEIEIEKARIQETVKGMDAAKDVFVVNKNGEKMELSTSEMTVEELLKYRKTVVQSLEDVTKDLDALKGDSSKATAVILSLHEQIERVAMERNQLIMRMGEIEHINQNGKEQIRRDATGLKFAIRRHKAALGIRVFERCIAKLLRTTKKTHF